MAQAWQPTQVSRSISNPSFTVIASLSGALGRHAVLLLAHDPHVLSCTLRSLAARRLARRPIACSPKPSGATPAYIAQQRRPAAIVAGQSLGRREARPHARLA